MTETFTVTAAQLERQLADGSTWQGNHRVWSDPQVQVITEDGAHTPAQVVFYLATHRWVDELFNNCGVKNCITTSHLSETKPQPLHQSSSHSADAAGRDEADLILMQTHHQQSVSLAALYRKGKARGLLRPATTYGG